MISFEMVDSFTNLNSEQKSVAFSETVSNLCRPIEIDRVSDIAYEEFLKQYLLLNNPCLFSHSKTEKWKCIKEWVHDEKPNFGKLEEEFGFVNVPVANCLVKEYNSHLKHDMLFKDFISYWKNFNSRDDQPLLYLKDWHFNKNFPKYKAYDTPVYFTSDWLNEFYEERENDDYQFVYMGPKGTWTPLHADVFGSYSWSANICGRKRWLLFPPGMEKLLCDPNNKVPYSVTAIDLNRSDISYIDVVQEPGEIIFVPSGWFHQVWNLDDVISVNHNWFNGCNLQHIWNSLSLSANDVETELLDCKEFDDWENQVQIVLKVHHGMNYEGFVKILNFIFESRRAIYHNYVTSAQNRSNVGHSILDIFFIKKLLPLMLNCKGIPREVNNDVKTLRSCIESIFKNVKLKQL